VLESRYRRRTNDFLTQHGRVVLTFRDQITRGVPDTAVTHSGTVWVEHKVLRKGSAYTWAQPLAVDADLRRDTQLHTMVRLESRGRALYMMHVEASTRSTTCRGTVSRYLGSVLVRPSLVAVAVANRRPLLVLPWEDRAAAWSVGAVLVGSLTDKVERQRLLEVI